MVARVPLRITEGICAATSQYHLNAAEKMFITQKIRKRTVYGCRTVFEVQRHLVPNRVNLIIIIIKLKKCIVSNCTVELSINEAHTWTRTVH